MRVLWLPLSDENKLLKGAKAEAREAAKQGAIPQKRFPGVQLTALSIIQPKVNTNRALPEKVRRHSECIDAALPGKQTRQLYD